MSQNNVRRKVENYVMNDRVIVTSKQDVVSEYDLKKDTLPIEQKKLVEQFKNSPYFSKVRKVL